MKSVLFFIHFILTLNILYSQEYKLNYIGSNTSENKIKSFETYKDLVLEIEDSLISLKKTGNINATVKSFLMIDSLNFNVEIEKNQKIKYLQVINEAKFDELVKSILSSYKSEEGLIKIDETDIIAREISKKLSKEGFPFAKVSFKNHDLSQSSVIRSNLNIDYG